MKKVMNESYHPLISEDVPSVYNDLIEKCCSPKAQERPSFDEIVSELKTNAEFITEIIEEAEYYDYIDFIDNYQSTFNVTKRAIRFSDFIKQQDLTIEEADLDSLNDDKKFATKSSKDLEANEEKQSTKPAIINVNDDALTQNLLKVEESSEYCLMYPLEE